MPTLSALIARGVSGNIATLDPPFSPMLWTTIGTGHTADRHGILHFVQPDESGTSARPVMGSTRKVKALWNILTQQGMRSNVVGWWPSHPVEPIAGAMVSNFYQHIAAPVHEPWTPLRGAIHPPGLADTLNRFRVHPGEITGALLQPFLPDLAGIDQANDPRPVTLAKILAETVTVHAAATYLMEHEEWDLTAVYYDAIDHVGHAFMKYHPPRLPTVTEEEFHFYQHVVTAMYRFHDMMLERLLQLAGEETTVILLSDHGFHSDHLRPLSIPKMPAGPAVEHRNFGIAVMAGPGIRRGEPLHGASLLNVTPTVLTLFGLPVGDDMRGHPLLQAFETPPEVARVPSWEDVPGESGRPTAEALADPWAEREALQQLIALGYVSEEETSGTEAADRATREATFNLARVYRSTGRLDEALMHFEAAASKTPDDERLATWLAQAYFEADRVPEARGVTDRLLAAHPESVSHRLLDARLRLAEGDAQGALDALNALLEKVPAHPEFSMFLGDALLVLKQWEQADEAFRDVLEQDPDNARAHHGRAMAALGRKDYGTAAEAALAAIERLYHFPTAHFHLGVALMRLGWVDRAEQAFQVCVAQRPVFRDAHHWLARIYNDYLRQPERAAHHYRLAYPDPVSAP